MIKLTLTECVKAMQGRPHGELSAVSVGAVSTDSRTTRADELFFALHGDRFDGHDYVCAAIERGAVCAVVDAQHVAGVRTKLAAAGLIRTSAALLIEVDDTTAALGRLAAYHRRQMAAQVIGVVGSNGKTTTKAMIHHILSGKLRGRCSPKSFNNAVGVPLTLLSAEHGDEYLVVEIGTNHPGEIAVLGAIAQPDAVVITCIGEEHLEGLGSIDGVAAEECSILTKLSSKGFAAVNIDWSRIRHYLPAGGINVATFGRAEDANVRVSDVGLEPPWLRFKLNARFPFRMKLIGEHNAMNAAGAVTIARRMGLDFGEAAARLESFVLPPMRNEIIEIDGVTLINDAYNANPQSAVAAIETLEQYPCRSRRIAVFGEMRELGPHSAALHRKVAERLRGGGIQHVILVGSAVDPMVEAFGGNDLFGPTIERCDDVAACAERLAVQAKPGDVVMLKASRAVALDRVIDPLRQRLRGTAVA